MYGPSQALDGNVDTMYHPVELGADENRYSEEHAYLQIDFGGLFSVVEVSLAFRVDSPFPVYSLRRRNLEVSIFWH